MAKTYERVILPLGCSIEGAVKELWKYRDESRLMCARFNGVMLYSDEVTMDNAHLEIVGMTKAEFDEL